MGYNLINWENSPSKQTPINAENLNQMDENIAKAIQGTRFNFSATFTSDGVLKNTTSTEALDAGSFATSQTDIVTVFVADNVTKIYNGAFSGCTSLKTIYIDNTVGNVEIVSGAVPSGVSIVYSNDDNFLSVNELLASAIKSLKKQVNADKSDWESRATSIEAQHKTDVQALTDKANSIVEQANTDRQNFNNSVDEINTTLDTKENVSNKVSEITHPSLDYYPDTKAVFDYVNSKLETPLADIETLKSGKLDKTDFNSYKTSNDNAVNNKVNTTDFNAYKSATDTDISKCVTDIANNSALISKNQINVTTDKSTSIVLNDSSDCNIVDLICDSDNYNLSIYGKNLFNLKNTRIWINNYVVPASLIVDNNSINFEVIPGSFCGVYIRYNETVKDNLLLDKSCVISLNVTADKDCKFRLRDESTNIVEIKNLTSNVATQFNLPITLNNSMKAISMYGIDIGENTHIKISNIMIELGAVATEYEDYKDFQSVTQDTDLSTVKTNYPNTTVICDSDFVLTYVADTKNYIDNKFNELATAIVAHESEVN